MLGILAVYRVGAFIPTPGVDFNAFGGVFLRNGFGYCSRVF